MLFRSLTPANLLFALAGCVLGTLIGVLPGLGPAAGTAILIPLTFKLDPAGAIIMLAAIYYGAMYGGTITSVLINVPGEAASVVTCLDGYQMARQGRAGTALGIAAIGSFVGGVAATIALAVVALPLARLALSFGPPEFFCLMLLGLALVTGLAGRSLAAALLMTVFGLLLALIGIDPVRGAPRFTFGMPELYDGIGFIPVVMGLFGIAEILITVEQPARQAIDTQLKGLLPSREEWRRSRGAIGRGTVLGFFLGLIPGVGAVIPTFMAYILEKRLSREPEKFGTGVIEGVAAPETANNSYANASMIPLLALGIPSSPTIAVLMGAFQYLICAAVASVIVRPSGNRTDAFHGAGDVALTITTSSSVQSPSKTIVPTPCASTGARRSAPEYIDDLDCAGRFCRTRCNQSKCQ